MFCCTFIRYPRVEGLTCTFSIDYKTSYTSQQSLLFYISLHLLSYIVFWILYLHRAQVLHRICCKSSYIAQKSLLSYISFCSSCKTWQILHPYMALQLEVFLDIRKLDKSHPSLREVDQVGSNLLHHSYTLGCYWNHHKLHHRHNLAHHSLMHGLLYFLWINHSFPNFENAIFYKIF